MSWNIAKPGDQINGPVAVTGNLNVDANTLFVDSANNRVGVLTASPTVPLDVVGDAKVSGNLTVDTNTLVVDAANNRLGIGTATPVTKLHINGEVALPLDNLIYWNAYYGTGAFRNIAAGKSGYIATLADGSLQFSNTTASAASADQSISFSERLRIASDGVCTWSNVGGVAGTAMTLNGTGLGVGVSPSYKLDVAGLIRTSGTGYDSVGAPTLYLRNTTASTGRTFALNSFDSGGFQIFDVTASNATRLIIDPSGNLGLGVTPNSTIFSGDETRLVVKGNANYYAGTIAVQSKGTVNAVTGFLTATDGSNAVHVGALTNSDLIFYTNGTSKATLTSGGNLGLGVTPSAWVSYQKAFEFGGSGNFGSLSSRADYVELSSNSYFNSSAQDIYKVTGSAASRYYQSGGVHAWSTAPSGTAGNAITFTQAMTLDASGRLLVGNASAGAYGGTAPRAEVYNTSISNTDADGGTQVLFGTSNFAQDLGAGLTFGFKYNTAGNNVTAARVRGAKENSTDGNFAGYLAFDTRPHGGNFAERLRIKSTGQVNFVGQASDPAGAAAGDVYYNTTTNKLKCYNGTTWNDLF